MGQNNGGALTDESQLTKVFAIKQRQQELNLTFLEHLSSHKQYILRNATFNQQSQQLQSLVQLNHRQTFNSPYLTNLIKYEQRKDDGLCSKHYRLASLWEYPHRTLADQINARALSRQPFTQIQVKALLRQMAEGLFVLQNNRSCHECLTTRTILVQDRARFRVVDPAAIPVHSNLDLLYQKRGLKNIYLSPEQCRIIDQQDPSRLTADPFREDVFVGAMVVLQAGLLQRQDECYQEGCSRVNWGKLQGNINSFQTQYGRQLRSLLEQMLSRQTQNRPDWGQIFSILSQEKIVPEEPETNYRVSVARPRQTSPMRTTTVYTTTVQQPETRNSYIINYQNPIHTQIRRTPPPQRVFIRQPVQLLSNLTTIHRSIRPTRFTYSNPPNNNINHYTKPIESHIIENDFRINSPTLEQTPVIIDKTPLSQEKRVTTSFESGEQAIRVVQHYENGASYEGFKLNGKREGWGRYRYQEGGSYEGEWRGGLMCGHGKLFYQSGKVAYEGQLQNDLFHGQGILYNEVPEPLAHPFDYNNFEDIDENWISYEGQFREDKKEGRGVLLLTNGQRFEGSFHEDKVQGEGVYRTQEGREVRGVWHQNCFQRQLS